jgi:uncharacterized membrane protein
LVLNIYYSSLAYTKISETQALKLDQLISAIGGNMGLFVGMSVLTICDFIQLILCIFYTLITGKYENSKQVKPE